MSASAPTHENPVLAVVTRSGRIESWHRGAIVICHADESAEPAVTGMGDVDRPVFARSATKPLQALPFLERGLHERLSVPAAEIAVMCASHEGSALHTATVRSFLQRGGFAEDQLGCGPHLPFDLAARQTLFAAGGRAGRIHNNCSGKHTGFLHLARACGDDPARYLEPGCRSQQEVAAAVAAMAGLPAVEVGLDGCGAPTFVLPLAALARAFCRLANPAGLPPVRSAACRTILDAIGQQPVLLAGERRLCTALARTWPGRVVPKNGAEGVYAVALAPDPARRGWPGALGIAVKIDDGSERAFQAVIVEVLRRLGAFGGAEVPAALLPFHRAEVRNTNQHLVGEVRSVVEWPA